MKDYFSIYTDSERPAPERAKALLALMTVKEKVGQLNQRLYGFNIYRRNGNTIELTEEFEAEVERFGGLGVLYGLYRADPWADRNEETGITPDIAALAYNTVQHYVIEHSRLHISDLKGITGGVRIANRYHFGWKMTGFEPDSFSDVAWEQIPNVGKEKTGADADGISGFVPTIYRGRLEADVPADTFLRLDGMHKGVAYINGFNLGRYWNDAGPQKTLYVPAPVLKKGENEVIIIELDGVDAPESPHVLFVDREEL